MLLFKTALLCAIVAIYYVQASSIKQLQLLKAPENWNSPEDVLLSLMAKRQYALYRLQNRLTGATAAELLQKASNVTLVFGGSYYGPVNLGTPNQSFNVIFDTGVADFLVPNSLCQTGWCVGKAKYNSSLSSTFFNQNSAFTATQGSGTASGQVFRDVTNLASSTVQSQLFGAINSMTGSSFVPAPCDGQVGLAFNSLSSFGALSVFENMINQGLVPNSVFSFYFGALSGEIVYGGLNSARLASAINWLPLTTSVFWSVRMDSVQVGASTVVGGTRAIFDTSFAMIAGPTSAATSINQILGGTLAGTGLWVVPCNTISRLPIINMIMSGRGFALKPIDYIIQSNGVCYSSFTALDFLTNENQPGWIIGQTFLRPYYSIYDYGNRRVGIALSR